MAFPTTRDELNQVISEQIRASFSEKKIADIDKLEAFFPVWDRLYSGYTEFTTEFSNLKSELEVLKAKLNEAMPQLQEGVRKGLSDLESRAEAANVRVATSVTSLEKRDHEISEKLKESFSSIDSQIESVSLQSASVVSMQSGIHDVVAKQQRDMDGMKGDIERYLANAMATLTTAVQSNQSHADQQGQASFGGPPREREAPQLNDPKKNDVDMLTDSMSKASFVLWRDNLDLHLEGCNDFGMGTSEMLKLVRLHPRIVDRVTMNDFNTKVRREGESSGNMLILKRWDTSRADRDF